MSVDTTVQGSTECFSDEFDSLIRPHLEVLRRVALKLTRDPSDADDLVQDVLLKVYQNREKLDRIKILKPWLVRVMRNLFIDQVRHAALEPVVVSISQIGCAADSENADEACIENFDCSDETPGPEKIVYWQQLFSVVSDALQRLPANQSMPVILHLVVGLTMPEVAAQMHVPLNTVKSNLRRTLDDLRVARC